MRKQTKLVAVLSAAALLAIGASMTSFAATGWTEENGTWVYYDKDGSQVTDQWEKSGDNWFYLNGDGEMATDKLIDDGNNFYYVDTNGAMVSNRWVSIENENAGDEEEPDANWYYFQANGKAYKSADAVSWKTINGKKYAFDSDAKMLYGWVSKSDSTRVTGDLAWQTGDYFCGSENDGARASGWAKIDVTDDNGDDQSYWFYFSPTNGTKTVNAKAKGINGKKYAFDENGVMQSKWYFTASTSDNIATSSVQGYGYYNQPDEGWRLQKGWVKAVPAEDVDPTANENEDTNWYYADGSGKVYNTAIKTINGKKYAFNQKGAMLSGLWALKMTDGGVIATDKSDGTIVGLKIDSADNMEKVKSTDYDGYEIYYFGGGEDGAAKTGNQNIDIDGDAYTYTFGTSGSKKYKGEQTAEVTTSTKAIYVRGQKVKADKDYRYQGTDVHGNVSQGKDAIGKYLVNTSGSIMKNKKGIKDSDDYKYTTNNVGKILSATQD